MRSLSVGPPLLEQQSPEQGNPTNTPLKKEPLEFERKKEELESGAPFLLLSRRRMVLGRQGKGETKEKR